MIVPPQAEGVRRSCRAAAAVMSAAAGAVKVGATTADIELAASKAMSAMDVRSAFLGYNGYPFSACVSVNQEILHGMASIDRRIAHGDIVKVDLGVVLGGYCSDIAQTFVMDDGRASTAEKRRLSDAVLSALMAGITVVKKGNTNMDVARAINSSLGKAGFVPVRDMEGHGVGRRLHEPPGMPNYERKDSSGVTLVPGMTLAIEPMAGLGKPEILVASDGWTLAMADGQPSAHWEHVVLVTDGEPEILTKLPSVSDFYRQ